MFPYEFYINEINSSLKMGGVLIFDLSTRNDDSGVIKDRFDGSDSGDLYQATLQYLKEHIGEPEVVRESKGYHRIAVKRTIL